LYRKDAVTPCVGVWIETFDENVLLSFLEVTPCVGVWIETFIVQFADKL